ncbi:hypothetical protein AB0M02_01490 [Actinoplanes sp. NPDC051861]|uniref:hypothetical protein n=1 Tax=Actinoplanes sp. NPDC051861 TaxID=3155170 RepID=UPI00342D30A5
MRRDRVVRLLATATFALTGTGCAEITGEAAPDRAAPAGAWRTAGCEFSRAPREVRAPVTPRLGAAIERIQRGGHDRFAASFAGLEVDRIRVRATVYRVPSSDFDDFVRRAAQDSCIVVRDAAHTAAELDDWHDRVVADLAYWDEHGIRIATVGSRHDGVGVEIGTRDFDRARRQLPGRYGSGAPLVFLEERR